MRPESSEPSGVLQRLTRLDKMSWGTYKGKKKSMKRETQKMIIRSNGRLRSFRCGHFLRFLALTFLAVPSIAHASLFRGETLDSIANGISWVVLIIGPIIGIVADSQDLKVRLGQIA